MTDNFGRNQVKIAERDEEMNIYDLYHRMESNKVVLSFKGDVTSELMSSILQIIEQRMDDMNEAPKLRKKVYNVLVECLQNLYHHIDEVPSEMAKNGTDRSAIFMISLNNNGYSITTGNYILTERKDSFQDRLDRINSLDREELKDLYKEVLNSDGRSVKGGGGLGMIDIAQKTGKKLNYEFAKLNEEYSFFSLNINVDEN
ncbi:MAG: SiaB family protein kinase [Flavobacteriales bacterium]|nr:SiaB family protein kinase [Flavobacteriales bacterium]